MAKIVVEAHDAVNFGAREIENIRNQRDAFARHPSKFILDTPQNRQQRARLVLQRAGDRLNRLLVPRMLTRHRNLAPAAAHQSWKIPEFCGLSERFPPFSALRCRAHFYRGSGSSVVSMSVIHRGLWVKRRRSRPSAKVTVATAIIGMRT